MGALLPLLLPLLPALINSAEAAFAAPKSGSSKANAVIQGLEAFLSNLFAAKQAPAGSTMPTPDQLSGMMETFLAQMRLDGTLTMPGKPAIAPVAALYLVQGTVSQLKVA